MNKKKNGRESLTPIGTCGSYGNQSEIPRTTVPKDLTLRLNTNLCRHSCKTIKPMGREDLHLPPPPTVQTTSSSTLTLNDISKNLTSKRRERGLFQGGQPAISIANSATLASLHPERRKKGCQAFRNPSSILAISAIHPEPHTVGREQEVPCQVSANYQNEPKDPQVSSFSSYALPDPYDDPQPDVQTHKLYNEALQQSHGTLQNLHQLLTASLPESQGKWDGP